MPYAVTLLVLLGCGHQPEDPRHPQDSCQWDTNCHQPEPARFDLVSYACDTSSWSYHAELSGWTELVTLDITQSTSSPWEETWELVNTDYDPSGTWDIWDLEIEVGDPWNYHGGTLFPCTDTMRATMAWRLQAWWHSEFTDCVVWAGADADPALLMDDGCRVLELTSD